MVVDLLEKSRVNIKELTIPEGKPYQPVFDPKKEVTDNDWEHLLQELYDLRTGKVENLDKSLHLINYTRMAVNLKIIDQDKTSLFGTDLETLSRIKKEISNLNLHRQYRQVAELAANARLLYPQETDASLRFVYTDYMNLWKNYNSDLERGGTFVLSFASSMAILFPRHRRELDSSLSQIDWQGIESILRQLEERGEYWALAQDSKEVKLIAPQHALALGQGFWQKAKGDIKSTRMDGQWDAFAALAASLVVLSAKEAKITDQGIEIIPSQVPSEAPQQTIPTRRKF